MTDNTQPGEGPSAPTEASVVAALLTYLRNREHEANEEKRRERFWRNVRAVVMGCALALGPIWLLTVERRVGDRGIGDNYVALVRIQGVISADTPANGTDIGNALEKAFEDKKAKGVVIEINSPGGSPVQSSIIRDRIVMLRESYPDKKVWAVGEDMLTSGAYFIAMGSPNVCVNRSTVAGSIGVITDGWGLDKFINKLGIERRVFTAGDVKSRLDTFRPLTDDDQAKVKELLGAIHEHFKSVVREGRGKRLKIDESKLFSGDYWTGEQAVAFGLADRLCDLRAIMAEEFQVPDAKDYTPPKSLLANLSSAISTELAARLDDKLAPRLLPR